MFDLGREYLEREGLPVTTSNARLELHVGYWSFRLEKLSEMRSGLLGKLEALATKTAAAEQELSLMRKEWKQAMETHSLVDAGFELLREKIGAANGVVKWLVDCEKPNLESELLTVTKLLTDARDRLTSLQPGRKGNPDPGD